jgi:hypothetical protein
MAKRIIHVVGLQKSGTSLLVRLLENSGHACFLDGAGKTEGGIDWGQRPSFSPTAWPAGTIYQRTDGEMGHQIDAADATPDICRAMRKQAAEKLTAVPTAFGISKVPYDMVRLPWVRAVLPELFIVGIVRHPGPNVYSLWKRFQPDTGTRPPEDDWWGVKPAHWRELIRDDKVAQIAHQWCRTNLRMWQDRAMLDSFITYDELCAAPATAISSLLSQAARSPVDVAFEHDALPSCDNEYRRGGRLVPRRREWVASNDLVLSELQEKQLPPFTSEQMAVVESLCKDATRVMGIDTK